MIIENENSKVKEWYLRVYSTDECGEYIDENITFYDIFYALDRHKDIYDTIGGKNSFEIDSIIRERIFIKLAEIMGCPYDYIYNQWLSD